MLKKTLAAGAALGIVLSAMATAQADTVFVYRHNGKIPTQLASASPDEPTTPPVDESFQNTFSMTATLDGATATAYFTLPNGIQAKGPISIDVSDYYGFISSYSLPTANNVIAEYSAKLTVEAKDSDDNAMSLDLYATMTGPGTAELSFFDASKASSADLFFPYVGGALDFQNVTFALPPAAKSYLQLEMNGGWKYECETDLTAEGFNSLRYAGNFESYGPIPMGFGSMWLSQVGTLDWADFNPANIFGLPSDDVYYSGEFAEQTIQNEYIDLLPWPMKACITPFELAAVGTIGTGQGIELVGGSVVSH